MKENWDSAYQYALVVSPGSGEVTVRPSPASAQRPIVQAGRGRPGAPQKPERRTCGRTPSNPVHVSQVLLPVNIAKPSSVATERESFYKLKLSKVKPVVRWHLSGLLKILFLYKYERAQS